MSWECMSNKVPGVIPLTGRRLFFLLYKKKTPP